MLSTLRNRDIGRQEAKCCKLPESDTNSDRCTRHTHALWMFDEGHRASRESYLFPHRWISWVFSNLWVLNFFFKISKFILTGDWESIEPLDTPFWGVSNYFKLFGAKNVVFLMTKPKPFFLFQAKPFSTRNRHNRQTRNRSCFCGRLN